MHGLRSAGRGALGIGGLIASAACGVGGVVTPYLVRDSAGVQIVESRHCSWDGQPWTVAPVPGVRAGGGGPGSADQLLGVSDALRLADGRIAVADRELGRVRTFSAVGRVLLSMGSAGDGEGEFRSLERLLEWRGRLWAFDATRARLTSFDSAGAPEAALSLESLESAWPVGDVLAVAGRLVGIGVNATATYPPDLSAGRDTVHLFGLDPPSPQPVLSFPGAFFPASHRIRPRDPRWYLPRPSWATDGSSVYFSSGDRFELAVADPSGRTTKIVRRTELPPPLTRAEVARWRAMHLDGVPDDLRPPVERELARITLPETLPTYLELRVDPHRNVWARRFGEGAERWDVYRADGACLGTVRVPGGLRLLQIGAEHVLGVRAEHRDRELVQVHRLIR